MLEMRRNRSQLRRLLGLLTVFGNWKGVVMAVIGEYTYGIRADVVPLNASFQDKEPVEVLITLETEINERQARSILWAIYPNTILMNLKIEQINT
jgi:hypothetical protein